MLEGILTFAERYAGLIAIVGAASVGMLMISALITPWFVAQLPADYFSRPTPNVQPRSLQRLLLQLARNVLGAILLAAGLLMMIIPGPGLITLVLGLTVSDFAAKQRVIRHFLNKPGVMDSLNWMRRKYHRPPFN